MKREIVIDGEYSDWFEKATFVLKDSTQDQIPRDLMSYAEEIVERHMKKAAEGDIKLVSKANDAYQKQQQCKIRDASSSTKPQEYIKKDAAMSGQNTRKCKQNDSLQQEYEKLRKLQDKIRRREKYVNRFVVLSLFACILSLASLIFIGIK